MQPAVFGRHHRLEEACLAERLDPRAAGRVHIVVRQVRKRGISKARECRGEAAMPVVEKWPAQGFLETHFQLPSKTGFCLAAKARNARAKSSVSMHSAWATASASMALSTDIAHSMSSMRLVMAFANVGPAASSAASCCAWARTVSAVASRRSEEHT